MNSNKIVIPNLSLKENALEFSKSYLNYANVFAGYYITRVEFDQWCNESFILENSGHAISKGKRGGDFL